MAQQFGNTWWGAEWLRSLTHIDYQNRIPRGATYARNGSVKKVELKDNTITAKVAGRRPRPYSVTIIVPPFSTADIDKLMKKLATRPGIIAQLLNRRLDPEVMQIAHSCGLKIFPERWSDLKMQCSCPDWAVPCKHIAAVIYMISREIDNNPFIAFKMHNVDLLHKLEKRGITVDVAQTDMKVPTMKEAATTVAAKDLAKDRPEFHRADFSKLTDLSVPMAALLADNPPFAPSGDFKEAYVAELQRMRKKVERFFARRISPEDLFNESSEATLAVDDKVKLHFDYNLNWDVAAPALPSPTALLLALLRINPDFLPDYHPTVAASHQALMCALHLLAKGAAVPQLVQLANKQYAIRWMPAYIDSEVRRLAGLLEAVTPAGIVRLLPTPRSTGKPVERECEWMVSFFLSVLMDNLASASTRDMLGQLFFHAVALPFDGVGEKEIPGGIKSWTAAYATVDSDYRPVFSVEENEKEGFDLHIGVEEKRNAPGQPIALSDVLKSHSFDSKRYDILRSFTLLSSLMKEVYQYINEGATRAIHYTPQTFVPFLMQVVPIVRMLDIKVFMPKSLQQLIRPKATLKLTRKDNRQKGYLTLADLFSFEWQVALGDEVISLEEFMRLEGHADQLLKFKQRYIYMDANALHKMQEAFTRTEALTPAQMLQAALTEEFESAPIRISDEARQLIRELTAQEDTPLPATLNATLRPYQARGYSWMYRNRRVGFGSILADDMGLGKTLQTIALVLKLKEEGALEQAKVLIVAPTGLLTNWQAEIARFAPTLTTQVYHGTERSLKHLDADILLTTYGVLRSDSTKLKKITWTLMVIDEAQNIKNHDTAQSKAVRAMPAHTHIALSGTPVENRLTEFWSIMDYANKGYLGSVKLFKEQFANPIQLYNDGDCTTRFRKITAPFMMRRMKTDKAIISDLPDKIENDEFASLKPEQAALYNQTLEKAMFDIEQLSTNDKEALFKRQGLILQMMLALKQICNHPAHFLKNGDWRPEQSGKAEMLLDRIESIVDSGEKVLVFTQFREMGEMIVQMVEQQTGRKPLFYHGGCNVKQRKEMVERFQQGRADKVFVLSLKAAGTGLNLTAATHVIHYDLWWNPAVEAQATDRAYRIGQNSNVIVHRFITKDTFEERINDMIQDKKHLADMTVASGESWIGKLSNSELRDIFG